MRSFITEVKDIHKGQDVYIVGKGPSLQYLTGQMIGKGIIITLNDAILKIDSLNLTNLIYSMQKDCPGSYPVTNEVPTQKECVNKEYHNKLRPKNATLLVHKHESIHCSPDYSPRMVFDNLELGLLWHDFSWMSAIRIGQEMGCEIFYFISFDAFVFATEEETYGYQRNRIIPLLNHINHQFITPKNDNSYYTHRIPASSN